MDNIDEVENTHGDRSPEVTSAVGNLRTIMGIPVTVQVVLGSTTMPVAKLMNLTRGAVINLDQRVGEPVSIVVNGKIVAKGEIMVLDEDNSRFGVSLTEVIDAIESERAS